MERLGKRELELGLQREPEYESEMRRLEGFSRRYVRLALEAYDAALISERELARFLHCDLMTERAFRRNHRMAEDDDGHALELDLAEKLPGKSNKAR